MMEHLSQSFTMAKSQHLREVSHLRPKVNHGLGHFRVHLHLSSKTRKDLQTWLQFSWSPSLHSCHTVIQLTHCSPDVNLLTCTLLLGLPKCFRRALHGSAPRFQASRHPLSPFPLVTAWPTLTQPSRLKMGIHFPGDHPSGPE